MISEIIKRSKFIINCEKRGGLVSHRRLSNGDDKPYELNISWWSAMEDSSRDAKRFQYERFILSQLLVMALKGVPAFYLPALLASENDIKSFSMTGQRRDLNREKFKSENLLAVLNLSLIHISEPTRHAQISYAVFCLKKKK